MSINSVVKAQEDKMIQAAKLTRNIESFYPGCTIAVKMKIVDGSAERTTFFRGICIKKRNKGLFSTCVVRKISGDVGVERVIPIYSPLILSIEVVKEGKVRRANLSYLRNLKGTLRVPEKFNFKKKAEKAAAAEAKAKKAEKSEKAAN